MNHTVILILGYGITWVGVLAYMLRLRRRERAMGEPPGTGGGIAG